MDVRIEPLTADVASYILEEMRDDDIQEIRALRGDNIQRALALTLNVTEKPMMGLVGGEPICIFGISSRSRLSGVGHPWLVGTPAIDNTPVLFLRRSREVFEDIAMGYRYLYNYVDTRNTHSIRWLEWLGFQIGPAESIGRAGELFHRFEMRRDN